MLAPKKKITKKEMHHDPLISAYDRATTYYFQYKKMIGYVVTGIVLVVVAIIVYTNNRASDDAKAATELGRVFSLYDAGATDPRQYKLAIEGQEDRGIWGLKRIVDSYGGTGSGQVARFYLANAYYNIGQYDDALKQFDAFSSSNAMLTAAAYAGMGRCYEAKGEFEKAGSMFEKAAGAGVNPASTPDYLSASGRCFGLGGEKEKAVTIFKKLKKEYPTSAAAREADRYISQFSA